MMFTTNSEFAVCMAFLMAYSYMACLIEPCSGTFVPALMSMCMCA
jgi:hypothetical protein